MSTAYTDDDVLVAVAAEAEWFFEGRSGDRGRMETVVAEMAPRIAARAKAKALREAAGAIFNGAGDPEQEFYDAGVSRWLMDRADQLERP